MASIIRIGARRVAPTFSRSFAVSAVSKKDLVQDLYINQLKAYKPAPQDNTNRADNQTADASSSVRGYKAPSSPKAPTLPTDLASELSKFDAEEPSFASPAAAKKAASTEGGESADEYLTFLEKDLPKADAHH